VPQSPENRCFPLSHCRLTSLLHGTPANIRISLILPESSHWATSSSLIVWVYLHLNFRGGLRKTHAFWNRVRNGPSRSSKIVDFGTNRKCVCNYLLVINSNLGPILPPFRDITGFLLRRATPSLFHSSFRCVPFGLDCRCCGPELVQPTCSRYINVINRRIDGRTTYDSNTARALRTSRGKNDT